MKTKDIVYIFFALFPILFLIQASLCQPATAQAQQLHDSPEQFLVDYENTNTVAIVEIQEIENRWIIIEHGDHVPIILIRCKMIEVIRSGSKWPAGVTRTLAHFDYSNLINQPIAPPPVVGYKFLLWADSTKGGHNYPKELDANYWAHPHGLLLIRDNDPEKYVYWNKKTYSLDAIRQHEKKRSRLALNRIRDPLKRNEIAQKRLKGGFIDDINSFIEGLMLNIQSPGNQAQYVEKIAEAEPTDDFLNFRKRISQFKLWYESLFLLKQLGDTTSYEQKVVNSLRPLVSSSNYNISLTVSLILAGFNDDSGMEVIVKAFRSEEIDLSEDPRGNISLPGRMKYDNSSVAASSYALGLLGDNRGLQHEDIEIRLAAADGLSTKDPNSHLIVELKNIAVDLNEKVRQLAVSGKLTEPRTKGDFTERYPRAWVKTHFLLARLGDNDSLKHLLDAYKTDLSTYPEVKKALTSQPSVAQWTSNPYGWPSLKTAIYSSDKDREKLLSRIASLMGDDSVWESNSFLYLRSSLGDKSAIIDQRVISKTAENIEDKISRLLSSQDAAKRAEGLAGAGYNQVESYYQKVIDTALNGSGIEKKAAMYGLSFYEKNIPPEVLRTLSSQGEIETRLMGIELATRKNRAPFAPLAVDLLKEMVDHEGNTPDQDNDYQKRYQLTLLTRVLSRFSQGEIPQAVRKALNHPNKSVRLYLARALGMGGNPKAISLLLPLRKDKSNMVREEVERVLIILGPEL